MGIKFAPLNVPIERRLQTLATGAWVITMLVGGPIGFLLSIYTLLYTRYWLIMAMYLIWAWTIDADTHEKGGRPARWGCKWSWWKYLKDYFPIHLETVNNLKLDSKRNYLFCSFPHGLFSAGAFTAFATDFGGFKELFPNHTSHFLTLKEAFYCPLHREYLYLLGGCSASSKSIKWILNYPTGGKVALLVVGGTEEAKYAKPNQCTLVLRKRKGFVKLAIQCGAPIVPVFTFGENEILNQVSSPEGSMFHKFQKFVKTYWRVLPVIPLGRGFLQYSFGFIPFRKPLTTIVGEPIEVRKSENPTQEEINALHEIFMYKLTELFETNKHKYMENADNIKIEII